VVEFSTALEINEEIYPQIVRMDTDFNYGKYAGIKRCRGK